MLKILSKFFKTESNNEDKKKFDEFTKKVKEAMIQAIKREGYNTVYITDTLDFVIRNTSEKISGLNIVHSIKCQSYSNLGYDKPEDFDEEDAEFYVYNMKEELQEVYNSYGLLKKY